MSRLEHAAEIADLVADLGLAGATNPVEAILRYCRSRMDGWVAEARSVTTIGQLENLVIQRLQIVFEEIRSDADFARITEKYVKGKKDPVFASMRVQFDNAENPTYGMLVRRKNVADGAPDRFVALIDCRVSRLAQRFFTKWHEIGHRMTTHADHGEQEPACRSEHNPIERMMDEIAGHVGFYGPFFEPVFGGARRQDAADVRRGEGGPRRRLPGGQLPGHAQRLRKAAGGSLRSRSWTGGPSQSRHAGWPIG